jgi:hypothetical protein
MAAVKVNHVALAPQHERLDLDHELETTTLAGAESQRAEIELAGRDGHANQASGGGRR